MPGSHEVVPVASNVGVMKRRLGRDSFLLACLWTTVFLASCSGLKPYQHTPDHNLHVRTAADSGSCRCGYPPSDVGLYAGVRRDGSVESTGDRGWDPVEQVESSGIRF
jgi:hypothetical protein